MAATDRWQQIESLLREAMELPVSERAELLDDRCADDPELRAEVEALLAADEEAGDFLSRPAAEAAGSLLMPDEERLEAEATELFVSRDVGPYRLVREIGRGGMGIVYEALDTRLERRVALKFLPLEYQLHPQARERFLREARAASALDHPAICTVHDIGESDGRSYIVMAYCEGVSLRARLEQGPLPAEEARSIATQLAGALERAHEAGITHRDLKPGNVIVNERGEATLLDFGIAKVGSDATLTEAGLSVGTPAYMSPEQAEGEEVDARTDLWSLGVMLYEMLAGRRPFDAENPQAVIHAILHREAKPLAVTAPGTPHSLVSVVERLLAKSPSDRYASAGELLADLRGEGGAHRRGASGRLWLAAGAALLLSLLAGWFVLEQRRPSGLATPGPSIELTQRTEATRLAVLFFQNLSGDAELDWLRRGFTDMLVTDLAQSPGLQVVSTGQLHQILEGLEALQRESLSQDLIQSIADRASVEAVLRGSYARVGERVRVSFTIEDPRTGSILVSDRFEGQGEESLFALVDELSAAVRNRFEVRAPAEAPATVEMITTSSVEAWRYFSEAQALHNSSKRREATLMLERAVEIDPEFALAFASLGRLRRSLGQSAEASLAMERAVELADRLPVHERFVIQADFYTSRWESYARGIEAYRDAVDLYPEKPVVRANFAHHLASTERYEEALNEYGVLFDEGNEHPGNYTTAAFVQGALGRFESGYRLLADFAETHPENWFVQFGIGWLMTEWGRYDEAFEAFDQAEALRPGEVFVTYARWRAAAIRGDLERADEEAARLRATEGDSFAQWRGAVSEARNALYRGRSEEALLLFEAATEGASRADAALVRCWMAQLHLDRGEPSRALEQARQAMELGRGEWPELEGLFLTALARQQLGSPAEADRIVEELAQRSLANLNPVQERRLVTLRGLLAFERGETEAALAALREAVEALPPRGGEFHFHVYPDHVPLWLALGRAERSAGNLEEARSWLAQAADSGAEHLEQPVPYIQSFYELGRLEEELSQTEVAQRRLRQFLDAWRDGDLDRQAVAAAQAIAP